MSYRKSLLVLAFAALGFALSAPTFAFLTFPLQQSGGTDSDGDAKSGGNLGTGSFAAVYYGPELPPSPLFTVPTPDGNPRVDATCFQVDGSTECDSTVNTLTSTGTFFIFSHHNSKNKPDTVTCVPAVAGDPCLTGFQEKQTTPAGNEITAQVQVHGSSEFDGIYAIESISGNTITIKGKFPTKTNGEVTEPNADHTTTPTLASISVFIQLNGTVYARIFDGTSANPGDEEPANLTLTPQPTGCPNDLPMTGKCSQDGVGDFSYRTAAIVACATDPVTGARTNPCEFSANLDSNQTGRVVFKTGASHNINQCVNGTVFTDCTYFIGDSTKINKRIIDLFYPATAIYNREEVFNVISSDTLGFSAANQRGCGSGFVLGDLTTYDGDFDCSLLVDQDSVPIYQVGVATNPTSINASSLTATYDLDVFPPEEVQGTTIVPSSLVLQYVGTVGGEERTATVATAGDPSCNNTTATCLHVKFSRLGTLCAVAYTGGTLTPGQSFSLPLRGQINNPESVADVDGLLRHDDANPKMTYGGNTDFSFDATLCAETGLMVTYDPEL